MKITVKQYARSLYESLEGREKKEIGPAISNFLNLLINNNDISKTDNIIDEFENIWNLEQKITKAKVVSARELEANVIGSLSDYVKQTAKSSKVAIEKTVDKSILGGVIIKHGDKVMDASLRARLNALKAEMKK
ncbi:MAG: ATP synthase F1 subunit delta [Patescibacteria group bacterium]|nr:ATP synthase F1 subunit delta [Patescibacteria group bacterium]